MIERLAGMPPGTLGFRAAGEIEPDALWADSKLGVDLDVRHHQALVRSAIVTDVGWMAHAARMFAWMITGEARVFPRAELARAMAWVAGSDEA
jgi:hypothetical protein